MLPFQPKVEVPVPLTRPYSFMKSTAFAAHEQVRALTSEKTEEAVFEATRTVSSPLPSCVPDVP